MATPSCLATQGFVLSKDLTGKGDFFRSDVLSLHYGLIYCFHRQNHGSDALPPVELFDFANFSLKRSSPQYRGWLITDYHPVQQYTAIAKYYDAFCYACQFTNFLRPRLSSLNSDLLQAFCRLTARTLFAWREGVRPDIVFFKALYLVARHEGLPIREQWQASLPKEENDAIQKLLKLPISQQTVEPKQILTWLNQLDASGVLNGSIMPNKARN